MPSGGHSGNRTSLTSGPCGGLGARSRGAGSFFRPDLGPPPVTDTTEPYLSQPLCLTFFPSSFSFPFFSLPLSFAFGYSATSLHIPSFFLPKPSGHGDTRSLCLIRPMLLSSVGICPSHRGTSGLSLRISRKTLSLLPQSSSTPLLYPI